MKIPAGFAIDKVLTVGSAQPDWPIRFLLSAGSIIWCLAFATGASAATIVHDIRGYTLGVDGQLQTFTFLVFDDQGRVERVGTGVPPTADKSIEGKGRVLLPGLIDAHGHVAGLGRRQTRLDLTGSESLSEIQSRVRTYNLRDQTSKWLVGEGWNEVTWETATTPTAADLDAVVSDRPAFLVRADGHAAWVNTAALMLAGIDDQTSDPPGGRIVRGHDAAATGILIDAAMALVADHVPEQDEIERALDHAFAELASYGLTSVHDAGVDSAVISAYRARQDRGALPLRVYAMPSGVEPLKSSAVTKPLVTDRLVVRGIKLVADGALGNRGAYLTRPYADDSSTRGLLRMDEAELREAIDIARDRGFQVNVHAIGDAANLHVLNAFAEAGIRRGERHRIEHAQVSHAEEIAYLGDLGVVASMQPGHAITHEPMARRRLSADQLDGAYAWRDYLAAGATLAFGSDFPNETPNPFVGWHAAVSGASGWRLEHALTRVEAFHAYTLGAAYAGFMEGEIGSLEPGKWADFVLLDADPFEVEVDAIRDIRVESTWVAGARVFERTHRLDSPPSAVAPNVDLSRPVGEGLTVDVENAQPALTPLIDETVANLKTASLTLLGAQVQPATATRLTWSPGETMEVISSSAPVLVVNGSRAGPVLCLTGAIHGDELNGIETVRRVLYELEPTKLSGAVIGIPIVNIQGFQRASRYLVDRRDLNRYFPGNPTGSSASRIAYSLFSEVISKCDALVDVHTGSQRRTNLPQLRANLDLEETRALASAFDDTVVLHSVGGKGTLRRATTDAGIPAVTLEAGAPLELQDSVVSTGVGGIRNLMRNLEMVKRVRLWGNPQRVFYRSKWVRADRGGIFISEVNLGETVSKGEVLGSIRDPISNKREDISAPFDGQVLGMALNQVVLPGFATYRLGLLNEEDVEDAEETDEREDE